MGGESIAIRISDRSNRQLLVDSLSDSFDVRTIDAVGELATIPADCCLLDDRALAADRAAVADRKAAESPLFFPFLLLTKADHRRSNRDVREIVDDVVALPTEPQELRARVRNLLETRRLSRQFHETRERFESVVETASDGIIVVDTALEVRFANPAASELFGYSADALDGRSVLSLVPDHTEETFLAEIERHVDDSVESDVQGTIRTAVQHRSGREIPVELSYGRYRSNGETYLTGVVHDISHLERREVRLQVLNRILRHDVRNDINVIQGYLDLIAENSDIDPNHLEAVRENVHEIVKLSENARRLDYLFASDGRQVREIDAAAILDRQLDGFERDYPAVDFERDVPAELRVVGLELLESAFDNLIENAIEHNDPDDLTVRVSVEAPPGEEDVRIEIADTGTGIPAEEIEILERGSETDLRHVSGLGLWLVNWLVTESNGRIRFEDNDPVGSRVIIELPRSDDEDA